jgi:protein-disulfide isomerase
MAITSTIRTALLAAMVMFALPAAAQVPLSDITDTRPTIAAGDHVLGDASAPLTIFEYASLSCPHCAAFHAQTLPQLQTNWIATGKAKLVFRDFPLDAPGLRAAAVARCAPPERFFDIVGALFARQAEWARAKDTAEQTARIAAVTDLGADQVADCAADTKVLDSIVAARQTAATKYGVTATPTFFIGGRTLVGERAYGDFDRALREAAPQR